jgi:hypothetical protein
MSKNSISAWTRTYFYFVIVGGGEEQLLLDGGEAGAVHAGLVPVAPHYAAVMPSQHNTSSNSQTENGCGESHETNIQLNVFFLLWLF